MAICSGHSNWFVNVSPQIVVDSRKHRETLNVHMNLSETSA